MSQRRQVRLQLEKVQTERRFQICRANGSEPEWSKPTLFSKFLKGNLYGVGSAYIAVCVLLRQGWLFCLVVQSVVLLLVAVLVVRLDALVSD